LKLKAKNFQGCNGFQRTQFVNIKFAHRVSADCFASSSLTQSKTTEIKLSPHGGEWLSRNNFLSLPPTLLRKSEFGKQTESTPLKDQVKTGKNLLKDWKW